MPYVSRDDNGQISAVSMNAMLGCDEAISQDNAELIAYLASLGVVPDSTEAVELVRSDLDLVRVMEDLINILIEKNVICFTDLPTIAQKKINRRRDIRVALNQSISLLDDDDSLI